MKQEITIIIGERIRDVRLIEKMTQSELAEKTILSVSYISHIEHGRKNASTKTLIKIVNVLGVTVDEVLHGLQNNYNSEYQTDMDIILEDCTINEKKTLFKIVRFFKEIMREC